MRGVVFMDFMWWGTMVLRALFPLNAVITVVALVGLRRRGFLRDPNARRRRMVFMLIAASITATTMVVSVLGTHKWLDEVKPLKNGSVELYTDLDWAASGVTLVIGNGWPLTIFGFSCWRWRKLAGTQTARPAGATESSAS